MFVQQTALNCTFKIFGGHNKFFTIQDLKPNKTNTKINLSWNNSQGHKIKN